jgi:hypothetical protein
MLENNKWKSKDKPKSVSVKIEIELEQIEDLELCVKTIKQQLLEGIPYTEGVVKKGMYYTASLEYKYPADFREEQINGTYYRIINKTTNKWSG